MKKKVGLNIIRILISFILVVTGNFTYAVSHFSCKIDGMFHRDCEMECCNKDKCCSYDNSLKITSEKNNCCEIHSADFHNIDYVMPLAENQLSKISAAVIPISYNRDYISSDKIIKFSLSNLLFRHPPEILNLRI